MPKWQIDSQEYLKRLGLNRKDFEKLLKLPKTDELRKVLPLREMKRVQSIIPISSELLLYLIRRIRTLDGQLPFRDSEISQVVVNPHQLKIGQKFVYRENYQNMTVPFPPEAGRQIRV